MLKRLQEDAASAGKSYDRRGLRVKIKDGRSFGEMLKLRVFFVGGRWRAGRAANLSAVSGSLRETCPRAF